MNINTFEQAQQLATEFLATKERKNYYGFKALDEELMEEFVYNNILTDKEVASLRALKQTYGKDFVKHLNEVFDDPDIIHDFTAGAEILDIDLDYVMHEYAFVIHELKPDGTVLDVPCSVELKDDEYARLLAWHLFDDHLTINTLRQRDMNLYNTIMRGIDGHYYQEEGFLLVVNPYVPTLDEALADTETIIRQHDIKRSSGFLCLPILR